ncbi:MAG: hypothetical protein K0Q91_1048 [Fibrobacteria bacterium]|nr:hypothetical protein [Fibrobacteria bacterium]
MFLGACFPFVAFDFENGSPALSVTGPFQGDTPGFFPAQRGPRKKSLGGLQNRQEDKEEKTAGSPAHGR